MDALRSHLIDLAFSPYEADLYLALLKESPANGSQLARSSGVPRSMVYQALDRLVEKGAVLLAPGSPAAYSPVSPAEFFGRLQEQHAATCRALIQGLPQVAEAEGAGLVWNLKGAEAIRTRAREMYFRARGNVRASGDLQLMAQLLPSGSTGGAVLSPGWCVVVIPRREALMVEVSALREPVAAYGRQTAFVAAAEASVREQAGRRRELAAVPLGQFW